MTLDDYAACLAEVVDQISPTPAIIGHSMGGAIAERFLETHTVPAAVLLATLPQRGLVPYLVRSLRHNTRTTLKAILTLNTHHVVNSTVEEEKQTAEAYGADFELFPDQAHNLMAEPRWREVADAIDRWLTQTLGPE